MAVVLLVSLGLTRTAQADGAAPLTGRVLKVLPLWLNAKGQDALSPSLFERDAYQRYLLLHTNEIAAVRYDVQWKATGPKGAAVKIQLELRAIAPDGSPVLETLATTGTVHGYFGHWSSFKLTGDDYKKVRSEVAWRATVWSGDRLLGEQKSFLW
jgi:hypothetical protein